MLELVNQNRAQAENATWTKGSETKGRLRVVTVAALVLLFGVLLFSGYGATSQPNGVTKKSAVEDSGHHISVRGPFSATAATIREKGCPMFLMNSTPTNHIHTQNPTSCSVSNNKIITEFEVLTSNFLRTTIEITSSGASASSQIVGGSVVSVPNWIAAPSDYFYPVESELKGAHLLPHVSVLKGHLEQHMVPKQMILLSNNGDEYVLAKSGGISLVSGAIANTFIAFYTQVFNVKHVVGVEMSWATSDVVRVHVDTYDGVTKTGSLIGQANQVIDLVAITKASFPFHVNRNKIKLVW